jgi:hypothetical protein
MEFLRNIVTVNHDMENHLMKALVEFLPYIIVWITINGIAYNADYSNNHF